jgi:hypothetical protein
MSKTALETVAEALVPVAEFVAMVLLGTVGFLAEQAGVEHVAAGVDPAGVWLLLVGGLALYTSVYMIGYGRLLPRLTARLASAT